MKIRAGIALLLTTIFGFLAVAPAMAEVPLVTWERGRTQECVLAGTAVTDKWVLTLEGEGIEPLEFKYRGLNPAGYAMFAIDVPDDLPVGGYQVFAEGIKTERITVAGISLIEQKTFSVITSTLDLTLIIAIFIFITSTISTIRARKYSRLSFASQQGVPSIKDLPLEQEKRRLPNFINAPYRLRISGLQSLEQSLFRYLVIREGELLFRLSTKLYGYFPMIGFLGGVIAGVEALRNDGIANTGMAIFVAIALLSVFDVYSGLLASLGFWFVQVASGNVSSFRDLLVLVAVAIAWVGPALFGAIYKEFVAREMRKEIAVVLSGIAGGVLFFFGQQLANSLLYTDAGQRKVSILAMAVVGIGVAVKGAADVFLLETLENPTKPIVDERLEMVRVSSPKAAFAVIVSTFIFMYIWTSSAQKALILAALFTLPYILLFVRFNEMSGRKAPLPKRNILIESLVITAITFVIYREISNQPLLLSERGYLFMLLAAIPAGLHAFYSAICSSLEDREIISA